MHPFAGVPIETVGRHAIQVLGDSILMRYHGPYLPDHARSLLPLVTKVGKQHGRVRLLLDLSDAIGPPPETRRIVAAWRADGFSCLAIYFGASFLNRGFLRIIHAAMRAIGHTDVENHHFASETEALAFWASQTK
ncbi:MAG: hypothetical protein U0787_01755 [Polyangia bacterium]